MSDFRSRRRPRRSPIPYSLVGLAVLPLSMLPGFLTQAATASPGSTERVNISTGGVEADDQEFPPSRPAVSADGRFVAFGSDATNLVPGDTNGCSDVFVRDRATGVTERVSVTSSEGHAEGCSSTAGGGGSKRPAISADGRFVAFVSDATNLASNDGNGLFDVFVRDRQAGTTELVSIRSDGTAAAANLDQAPSISADGRLVAFVTLASLASQDTNLADDVYVRDWIGGTTELVSANNSGFPPSGYGELTRFPAISADGRFVAMLSTADLAGSPTAAIDVFVRDLVAHTTEKMSVSSTGVQGNGDSFEYDGPSISADGQFVSFESEATNLVAGDTNGRFDVFVRDRLAGSTERVSVTSAGGQAQSTYQGSYRSSISADGRKVAFSSDATNLVPDDTNDTDDIFVRDRLTGETTRENVNGEGHQVGGFSLRSDHSNISADGNWVTFLSFATDLVTDDTNGVDDVFIHQLGQAPSPAVDAPIDFDGDGDTDRSVYRGGAWYAEGQVTAFFGTATDIPVPANYDTDAATERAVHRDGAWYVDGQAPAFFGLADDVPVPGDYDGDGDVERAVYRPSVGGWYVDGQLTVFFGLADDIPVPGDYDGDGDVERAVYRPSVGGWYVEGLPTVFLGLPGDIPVPGQYDPDAAVERGVWRPAVGGWYVEGAATVFVGLNGDVPVPGDYDGDGDTDRGIWRPSVGGWYVQGLPTVFLGLNGDTPLALPQAVYRRFF